MSSEEFFIPVWLPVPYHELFGSTLKKKKVTWFAAHKKVLKRLEYTWGEIMKYFFSSGKQADERIRYVH